MEEKIFEKRINELFSRAYMNGYDTFSDFLNIDEQSTLKNMCVPFEAFGGYPTAERVIACFGENSDEKAYPISCILIKPVMQKFADELSHRDFLGALMNLGIKRELIGDIVIFENCGCVFCISHIADYICDNLERIRRTTVTVQLTDKIPESAVKIPDITEFFASSLRLDVLVSSVYKLSRSDANKLFEAKKIFVNSKCCENKSYTVKDGDIISVRGFGRFIYDSTVKTTKKNRLVIAVRKY